MIIYSNVAKNLNYPNLKLNALSVQIALSQPGLSSQKTQNRMKIKTKGLKNSGHPEICLPKRFQICVDKLHGTGKYCWYNITMAMLLMKTIIAHSNVYSWQYKTIKLVAL